jgi:hypothetical protein
MGYQEVLAYHKDMATHPRVAGSRAGQASSELTTSIFVGGAIASVPNPAIRMYWPVTLLISTVISGQWQPQFGCPGGIFQPGVGRVRQRLTIPFVK